MVCVPQSLSLVVVVLVVVLVAADLKEPRLLFRLSPITIRAA
jgi:hypothetical protein